jgi:hypothetical protein
MTVFSISGGLLIVVTMTIPVGGILLNLGMLDGVLRHEWQASVSRGASSVCAVQSTFQCSGWDEVCPPGAVSSLDARYNYTCLASCADSKNRSSTTTTTCGAIARQLVSQTGLQLAVVGLVIIAVCATSVVSAVVMLMYSEWGAGDDEANAQHQRGELMEMEGLGANTRGVSYRRLIDEQGF